MVGKEKAPENTRAFLKIQIRINITSLKKPFE